MYSDPTMHLYTRLTKAWLQYRVFRETGSTSGPGGPPGHSITDSYREGLGRGVLFHYLSSFYRLTGLYVSMCCASVFLSELRCQVR